MESALPPPTISFTIPSVHDTTVLSCRVYHPDSLSVPALSWRGGDSEGEWRGQVAVFAHPYAPLGGSADDGIVDVVAGTLVRRGYLVGTFNFRGAGDSAGRTSWTAKGEKDDYISVAAFMLYYAHHLHEPSSPRSPEPPVFLMGGYSYGAMITAILPPLSDLLVPFENPEIGSAAAEIRLRAEHLAELERDVLARAREVRRSRPGSSPRRSPGIRVGGTESGEVRRSADGRRSFAFERERIRKSIGDVVGRKRSGRERDGQQSGGDQKEGPVRLERVELAAPRVAYLLVSPLQGVITHLATMSFLPSKFGLPSIPKIKNPFQHKPEVPEGTEPPPENQGSGDTAAEELKLTQNPTLAIFGDKDVFVPVAKLRGWARRLQGARESRFHAVEVSTAGHFWVEEGVLDKMVGAVSGFSRGLVREAPAS